MTEPLLARLTPDALARAARKVPARVDPRDVDRLAEALAFGTYRPRPPRLRLRRKSSGGTRTLAVPHPLDRVVQRAVLEVVGPRAERLLSPRVHGYRPGRSPSTALRDLTAQVGRRPTLALVQADIADLFDTLDHTLLADALAWAWPDPTWLALCRLWASVYGRAGRGVGQGGPLAPLLANLYLARHLDPRLPSLADAGWIRYGDDIVLATARSHGDVRALLGLAGLARRAGLTLADPKVHVARAGQPVGLRILGVAIAIRPKADGWILAA